MDVYQRNNINVEGSGSKTMLLAHGFGCDQNVWRFIVPAFADEYRVVLFDHVGAGKSDLNAYSRQKYDRLEGYAGDVLEIIDAANARPAIFVGHSVSAVIGILAASMRPEAFSCLILVGPSPCYLNTGDYVGGFSQDDINALLSTLESNYLGWSKITAPMIMGNADRPELAEELEESFCRTDPDIAKHFARVTFLSDNRQDLSALKKPTLILQCSEDIIAPDCVGEFVHNRISQSKLVRLTATGHCPHLSAPDETVTAIRKYLSEYCGQ
ncbi:MAG: alpha/beta fold hydrolase [Bryobacteraceae bacterium]